MMEVIGIEKEGAQYQRAILTKKGKEFSIDHLETVELPPLFSSNQIVTGIASRDILVRRLHTSLTKRSALKKSLTFQLESLISTPLDEVMVKPIYRKRQGQIDATFVVTSKEAVRRHLLKWENVDPDEVSCVPIALLRFGAFASPDTPSYTVFHFGQEGTSIVSVVDHIIHKHVFLKFGFVHFASAFKKDSPKSSLANLMEIDFKKLPKKTYPALSLVAQKFWGEVDRAFCFLFNEDAAQNIHVILFTGIGATKLRIESWISQYDEVELVPIQVQNHRGYNATSILPYAIPIGLAIDALKKDELSVQLCQGDFVSAKALKKGKRSLLVSGMLSLICACTIFFAGRHGIGAKEMRLKQKLAYYLSEYENELPFLSKLESTKGLDRKVALINKGLKLTKNKDDYYAQPPRVSEFLRFLRHLPSLDNQIDITHIRYEMIDHPSLQHPLSPYKVVVLMEFNCLDGHCARGFHDALVRESDLIDDSEKVVWNRNEEKYEISFYLKR